MTNREVFLDTAFAIALSAPADQYHSQAVRLAEELESAKTQMVTTRAVLLEIGNALAQLRYRQAAVELLKALEQDPTVEIVSLSEALYQQAIQLYAARPDKEWGLTDCVSFVVMQTRGISTALTVDHHFVQAGFQILLK